MGRATSILPSLKSQLLKAKCFMSIDTALLKIWTNLNIQYLLYIFNRMSDTFNKCLNTCASDATKVKQKYLCEIFRKWELWLRISLRNIPKWRTLAANIFAKYSKNVKSGCKYLCEIFKNVNSGSKYLAKYSEMGTLAANIFAKYSENALAC